MHRWRWFLVSIISLLILYFGYFILRSSIFGFNPNYDTCKVYRTMFSDTLKSFLSDDVPCISSLDRMNVYNTYACKKGGKVVLWKFENLGDMDFKYISFREEKNIYDSEIFSGEILSYKTERPVNVKYRLVFNKEINVKLCCDSEIYSYSEDNIYKGFQGKVKRMVFEDSNDEPQIIFDFYDGPEPTSLYFFKKGGNLYFVMINSKDPLNLKFSEIIRSN